MSVSVCVHRIRSVSCGASALLSGVRGSVSVSVAQQQYSSSKAASSCNDTQ